MGSLDIEKGGTAFLSLEDGRYDARVLGIVGLGKQDLSKAKYPKPPTNQLKIIFEIPSLFNTDDENSEYRRTLTTSRKYAVTCGDRANLNKTLSAVYKTSLTQDACEAIVTDDAKLEACLGKCLKVDTTSFDSNGSKIGYANGWLELDVDLEHRVPANAQDTFIFFPNNPDMAVWNKDIKFHVKENVMSAINAASYPKELHQQFVLDQEAEEIKKQERAAKKDNKDDTSAIS